MKYMKSKYRRNNKKNDSHFGLLFSIVFVVIVSLLVTALLNYKVTNSPSGTQNNPVATEPYTESSQIKEIAPATTSSADTEKRIDGQIDGIVEGEFTINSHVPMNAIVNCHFCIPVNSEGRIDTSPSQKIICCLPFPTETEYYKEPMFLNLAKNRRLVVFGIFFKDMDFKHTSYSDRNKLYVYPESHSDDAIISAFNAVKLKFSLTSKTMILYGISGGASAAEQFSELHPEYVSGVACLSGGLYRELNNTAKFPYFLSDTLGDSEIQANTELFNNLHNYHRPVIPYTAKPEWGRRGLIGNYFEHNPDQKSLTLAETFIFDLCTNNSVNLNGNSNGPENKQNNSCTISLFGRKSISEGLTYFPSDDLKKLWEDEPSYFEYPPLGPSTASCIGSSNSQIKHGTIIVEYSSNQPQEYINYDILFISTFGYDVIAVDRSNLYISDMGADDILKACKSEVDKNKFQFKEPIIDIIFCSDTVNRNSNKLFYKSIYITDIPLMDLNPSENEILMANSNGNNGIKTKVLDPIGKSAQRIRQECLNLSMNIVNEK